MNSDLSARYVPGQVGEQAMLMDQLQDLSIEELRAAIEIVRSRQKEQKIRKVYILGAQFV